MGELGHIVDQNGNGAFIGHLGEIGDEGFIPHLIPIIIGGEDQGALGPGLGGLLGQMDSGLGVFQPGSRHKQFARGFVLSRNADKLQFIFLFQIRGFPVGAQHQIPGNAGTVPLFNVLAEGFKSTLPSLVNGVITGGSTP